MPSYGPFIYAMPPDEVQQQPDMFGALDEFVNAGQPAVDAFLTSLESRPGPNQGDFGPFSQDQVAKDHWGQEWTNAEGRGGSYWPYLTDLDIHRMLAEALATSIRRARTGNKTHTTVWLQGHPTPTGAVAADAQALLFTTFVQESAQGVQLVIVTPVPL
jgi:hypothetical protein